MFRSWCGRAIGRGRQGHYCRHHLDPIVSAAALGSPYWPSFALNRTNPVPNGIGEWQFHVDEWLCFDAAARKSMEV